LARALEHEVLLLSGNDSAAGHARALSQPGFVR